MTIQPVQPRRSLPVGSEIQPAGGTHFRVWAPRSRTVQVRLVGAEGAAAVEHELAPEGGGYFSALIGEASHGQRYWLVLDSGAFPDPVSRFQPEGSHGPSQIVDPSRFSWSDSGWKGVTADGQVLYEMHIGTFTREGTWQAAEAQLPELAALGITVIEVMPVADFPGRYGWGYDGVNLFAPTRLYGEPDEFRRFVDRAHSLGLGVILDVVYNHLGPDGNHLKEFSENYFSKRYTTEWGEAINFDGEDNGPVREFFLANAAYWISEFHLDGLRLDATQQMFDSSGVHILADLVRSARSAANTRSIYIVGENEPQQARLVRSPERGGYGLDALWNDDFHHTAIVAMTGRNEAYYMDYLGSPQEFVSTAKRGFLYQGQRYRWQKKRRGCPSLDLPPTAFVTFIQNHDQVANSLWGRRIHTVASAGIFRAMTALMLLGPGTPMLFQGQEFAASTPFLYFADHEPELAKLVAKGRTEFLSQFPSIATPGAADLLADPELEETFTRCKLDFEDRERNRPTYELHRDLLEIRKSDPLLGKSASGSFDGAILGPSSFCLRFFGKEQNDRLLVVNLGQGQRLDPAPEPLLAPPDGHIWQLHWSSEDPRYGGDGAPPLESEDENWLIPAFCAALLIPISETA